MSLQWSGNHLIQTDANQSREDILVQLEQDGDLFSYTVNAPGNLFGGEGGPTSIYSSSIRCQSEAEAKKKISRLKAVEIFHVLWLISLEHNNDSIIENIRNLEITVTKSKKRETIIRLLIAVISGGLSHLLGLLWPG